MELIANFEDIRSYNDNEYRIKAAKLLQEPQFKTVIETVMPEVDYELFGKKMLSLNSIHEFQTEIIVSFLNKLIANKQKGWRAKELRIYHTIETSSICPITEISFSMPLSFV